MPRIALTGGDYVARNFVASAQRCANLYAEPLPQVQDEPVSYAYYPTPGMYANVAIDPTKPIRCIYTDSNGFLWVVAGNTVYLLRSAADLHVWGTISSATGPVRMQDNGVVLVIVDGSANGWYITLVKGKNIAAQPGVTAINDPAFYGSLTIAVLDTFLVLAAPVQDPIISMQPSGSWYVSPSNYAGNSTPFDALYIAAKATYPDSVVAIVAAAGTLWVMGQYSVEQWYTAGETDFPFARVQGIALDYGCIAPYSAIAHQSHVFWLAGNLHGGGVVMHGFGTAAERISTAAVESAIATYSTYSTITDAIACAYVLAGHEFYVLSFPSANRTWVYDITTGQWHERTTLDANGNEQRYAASFMQAAFGVIFCDGPVQGTLYVLSLGSQTDDSRPIKRTRAFPHLLADGKRVIYDALAVDIAATAGAYSVTLDWSDDRGATFNTPLTLSIGGSTLTFPKAWRLGMARDRVFRVSWTDPAPTALLGAFADIRPVRS